MVQQRCKQLSRARLITSFGLDYTIADNGKVSVPIKWEAANLVTIKLPIATGIIKGVRLHKLAAPIFQEWFRMWSPEVCRDVKAFGGSYVPRLMRMAKNLPATKNPTKDWGSFLSRHSRGIAIDLNHNFALNKQGQPGVPAGEPGSLHRVIELGRQVRVPVTDPNGETWEAGLVFGADWSPAQRDFMHAEVGFFTP
jgi:hypothetical protein